MLLSMVVVAMVIPARVDASGTEEPMCVSKFDNDYEILNKLIDLEKVTQGLLSKLKAQDGILLELQNSIKKQGSTVTVWGKTSCPGNDSSLVYSGFMAGPLHTHTGSGSNYLCITAKPLWDHYEENTDSGGKIYGVEYQFWDHRSTGAKKFFGQNVFNKNAPCAICHVPRSTSVMIPGRNECYGGWTKVYSGYLVSGYHTHKQSSEYICLSSDLDFVDGNESNDDEARLYFVEGMCGKSLPCPPYVNGRELTCVVCSL